MNNELYHSDIYLGQDFSDGVKHFKYIKRERKNGRWVYYYSNEEYNKAKQASKAASAKADVLNKEYAKASREHSAKLTAHNQAIAKRKMAYGFVENATGLNKRKANKKYEKAQNEASKAFTDVTNAYKKKSEALSKSYNADQEASAAKSKYEKVAKKTKVQRAVGKTVVKVANKLSNASYKAKKKVDKGKKAISNLFNKKKK